ncbi:MAG: hypothetical protein E7370_01110 [Clostridiales bacterium]|nr:hypothetical protein [Clostridiales bacterium]
MTDKKARSLRLIYGICLSVLTVIVALLFIIQSQTIFWQGGGIAGSYTRDIVGEKLLQILAPVLLWLVAVVAGAIIWKIYPEKQSKLCSSFSEREKLERIKGKLPQKLDEDCYLKDITALNNKELYRKVVWGAVFAVCLFATIMCAIYLLNPANYSKAGSAEFNPTADTIKMLPHTLPYLFAAFACLIGATIYEEINAKKQSELVKGLIKAGAKNGLKLSAEKQNTTPCKYKFIENLISVCKKHQKTLLLAVRCAILVAGITLIVLDITLLGGKGISDVLLKAINICTECIGLG